MIAGFSSCQSVYKQLPLFFTGRTPSGSVSAGNFSEVNGLDSLEGKDVMLKQHKTASGLRADEKYRVESTLPAYQTADGQTEPAVLKVTNEAGESKFYCIGLFNVAS
jgi:hypothetical protein